MLDLNVSADPPAEDVERIIHRIGPNGIQVINSQIIDDLQSVDDLRKEIVHFWKRMNVYIGYEEKHPLVDEVPDPVKPLIANLHSVAPEKGTWAIQSSQ